MASKVFKPPFLLQLVVAAYVLSSASTARAGANDSTTMAEIAGCGFRYAYLCMPPQLQDLLVSGHRAAGERAPSAGAPQAVNWLPFPSNPRVFGFN